MNEYEKQGQDFLTKTKTTMTIKFLKHDKHFADDKTSRDIFKVVMKRNNKQYSFNFGQSINESNGIGTHKPTAYNILTCLQKHDVGTFENFCSAYGYDTDSRKAERTYNKVVREYNELKKLYNEDELNEMTEIQ